MPNLVLVSGKLLQGKSVTRQIEAVAQVCAVTGRRYDASARLACL